MSKARRDLRIFARMIGLGVALVAGSYALNHGGAPAYSGLLGQAFHEGLEDHRMAAHGREPVTVVADAYGQFHIAALANGAALRFLVDTGASDVTFRKQDAARLGLNPSRLVFDQTYWTANGRIRGASFRLHRLVIGACVLTDVVASINGGDLEEPLLGMSLLRRMNMTVADGTMTLKCKGET